MKKFLCRFLVVLLAALTPNILMGLYRLKVRDKLLPFTFNLNNDSMIPGLPHKSKRDTSYVDVVPGDLSGEPLIEHPVLLIEDKYRFVNEQPNPSPEILLCGDSFFRSKRDNVSSGLQAKVNELFNRNISYSLGGAFCSGFKVYNELLKLGEISPPKIIVLEVVERNLGAWKNLSLQLINNETKTVPYKYYGLDFLIGNNFRDINIEWHKNVLLRIGRISNGNSKMINGKKIHFMNNKVTLYERKFLDGIVSELQKTRDILKGRNIELVVIIAPDKETLYPEIFGISSLDTFHDLMSKAGIHNINLRSELSRDPAHFYFNGDSHWNSYATNILAIELKKYVTDNKLLSK